jgi:hypothetical protein
MLIKLLSALRSEHGEAVPRQTEQVAIREMLALRA